MNSGSERRLYPRIHAEQPVKWRDARGGRYVVGRTADVSAGGMCVTCAQGIRLRPGQAVLVSVPTARPDVIVEAANMTAARVMRCQSSAKGLQFAVRFDRPLNHATAAPYMQAK